MGREYIDTTGKTINDAIAAALAQLGLEREDISVEILTQPKQGFLGFGGQSAKIRAYYEAPDKPRVQAERKEQPQRREQPEQKQKFKQETAEKQKPVKPVKSETKESGGEPSAAGFLDGLFERMSVQAKTEVKEYETDNETRMELNIVGKDMGVVIGRRGEMLDAIQYITSLVVNKGREKHIRVMLDTENYRAKREESLVGLAKRMAEKAVKFKKNVTLEPMNSHERRVIHSALQEFSGVNTFSTGSEPYRRVVISPEGARPGDRKMQGDRRPQGSRKR